MWSFLPIPFNIIIIIALLTFSNTLDSSQKSQCLNLLSNSNNDNTSLPILQANINTLLTESKKCIDFLISNGHYTSLEYYLDELSRNHIQFRDTLSESINSIEKRLETIYNKYRFDQTDYQKVMPVFKWAQSLDDIYIEVKFAHRHDSPGCLEINNLTVEVSGSLLSLGAECILGDVPIKFELNLNMLEEINKDASVFSHNSVGRYQMTLRKKTVEYWKRLLKDENEVYSNMKTWIEMKEKYEEALKSYTKDENNEDDEEFKLEYARLEQEQTDKVNMIKKKRKEKKKQDKRKKKKEMKDAIDQKNNNKEKNDL